MSFKFITDLRFVIGLFFAIVGLILLGTWMLGPSDLVGGVHLNLISGLLIFVFGIFMLVLAVFFPTSE